MPSQREHLTASVVDGKAYVIGGRWGGINVATAEAYDPATDTWSALPAMPTARGGLASAPLDGEIHVFGGEDLGPGGSTFPEHEVFDVAANAWRSAPGLPTPRHGLTAQTVNGKIYVIGGGATPNLSVSDLVEVYEAVP
jgi:non-specific serine/threonine protein kinase